MIVAVDKQGTVVGMVALAVPTAVSAGAAPVAHELRDAVHPAWRGRGLYRALCRCRWLAALRMGVARVEGRTINPVAAAARLRMGYAALGGALYGRGLDDVAGRLG